MCIAQGKCIYIFKYESETKKAYKKNSTVQIKIERDANLRGIFVSKEKWEDIGFLE